MILSLDLPPGADISEASLVKELGISRTPVREALVRLTTEGFIIGVPHQSIPRVAPMDLQSVMEVLEALDLVQRAATRWAAVNRTAEDLINLDKRHDAFARAAQSLDFDAVVEQNRAFHSAVGAACGNRVVAEMYDGLLNKSLRIARLIFARPFPHLDADRRYDVVVNEHRAMLSAVRDGDPDLADRLAAAHARLFRDAIVTFVSANRSGEMWIGNPAGPAAVR